MIEVTNGSMIKLKYLIEEKYKSKIYCDMDGVLADFEKGFKKLTGKHPDEYPKKQFWAVFFSTAKDKQKEFWATLPWMSDGKTLWNYISKYKPELLTAPPNGDAEAGKDEWAKQNLGGSVKVNFKQARDKHHFVEPNAILIDDKESTIEKWNAEGGIGIYHTSAANTIKQLKKLGF